MSGKVTVYISNLVSNMEEKRIKAVQTFFSLTRKQQMRIQDVLSGAKIDFEVVDVSANKENLAKMREIVGNEHALAPQIANGDKYCGDYNAFDDAVECKTLQQFLKV